MFEKFSEEAIKVTVHAIDEAYQLGSSYCGTEHLLVGLASVESTLPFKLLEKQGVTLKTIRAEIEKLTCKKNFERKTSNLLLAFEDKALYSPRLQRAFSYSKDLNAIKPEHLLSGIIQEAEEFDKDGHAYQVMMSLGVKIEDLKKEL